MNEEQTPPGESNSELAAKVERLEAELARQRELAEVERRWETRRKELMIRTRNGGYLRPDEYGADASVPIAFFGLFVLGIGVVMAFSGNVCVGVAVLLISPLVLAIAYQRHQEVGRKADEYQQEEVVYQWRRRELTGEDTVTKYEETLKQRKRLRDLWKRRQRERKQKP